MRPASIVFSAAVLLLCAAGCSAQDSGFEGGAALRKLLATKTIAWSTHSYKPMTLKAGTMVTFKWAGYHNLAVSKLNEKSTRRCKPAKILSKARAKGAFKVRVSKGFYWYSCTVGNHCKAGQAILIRGV